MPRKGFLVLWMLAVSLMTATTLHAMEIPGAAVIECSGYIHVDGDGDQMPLDKGNALVHQHSGFHDGAVFIPAKDGASMMSLRLFVPLIVRDAHGINYLPTDPDLRPPIS